jgi:hypothetical protein
VTSLISSTYLHMYDTFVPVSYSSEINYIKRLPQSRVTDSAIQSEDSLIRLQIPQNLVLLFLYDYHFYSVYAHDSKMQSRTLKVHIGYLPELRPR